MLPVSLKRSTAVLQAAQRTADQAAAAERRRREAEAVEAELAKARQEETAAARQQAASVSGAGGMRGVSAQKIAQDMARERIAQIKERIAQLKMLLVTLGGAAAKAVLQELRQLGAELKQAAAALNSSSSSAPAASVAAPAAAASPAPAGDGGSASSDSHGEGRAAYAEQQAAADADPVATGSEDVSAADAEAVHDEEASAGTPGNDGGVPSQSAQRSSDRESIESVQEQLRALRKMAERMLEQERLRAAQA